MQVLYFAVFCAGLFILQSEISICPILTENAGKTPTVFNVKYDLVLIKPVEKQMHFQL